MTVIRGEPHSMGILFAGHMGMSVSLPLARNHRSSLSMPIQSCRLVILALLIVVACAEFEPPVLTHASLVITDPLFAQEPGESKWRKTRIGWVNLTNWNRPARVEFERRIELIHPITFSALMVLLSVGTLIWASDEYQWSRLMR